VVAFHEVRGAGRRSYLWFLRMRIEDVTKGFLPFSIVRDFHVNGAQNAQCVNYVTFFFLLLLLIREVMVSIP